tara:strand:- start:1220 stop:1651 length:432 start_codon:yes stop_codon:yes gene_type:complete
MGLDMYAYAVVQGGQNDGAEESLADWRKHNRLHGWMEDLWEDKGRPYEGDLDDAENAFGSSFNCVPVELTLEDLDKLEADINEKVLPETGGFFFGDDSFSWEDDDGKPFEGNNYYHKETDLQFIEDARKAINEGKKVYYNSWW